MIVRRGKNNLKLDILKKVKTWAKQIFNIYYFKWR